VVHLVLDGAGLETCALKDATASVQILGLLVVREMCVCNLVAALGTAASTLAHHLTILEEAGLVSARQDGKYTLYTLNEAPLRQHHVLDEQVVHEVEEGK
jgi:DNA-binding transcriptional ArsR family regulator